MSENNIGALLENGIITQEQYDAVNAYISENPDVRLDTQTLTDAGIINSDTASRIIEYAHEKHIAVHSRFANDDDDLFDKTGYSFTLGTQF